MTRWDAAAIVGDDQLELIVASPKHDICVQGPCVAGDVAERFAGHRRNLGSDLLVDGVEHPDEVERGPESEHPRRLIDEIVDNDAQRATCAALACQPEDRSSQFLDGVVLDVDDPLDLCPGSLGHHRDEALQGETGGKETLDHCVVEVAGDSFVVFCEHDALSCRLEFRVGSSACGDIAHRCDDDVPIADLGWGEGNLDRKLTAVRPTGAQRHSGAHRAAPWCCSEIAPMSDMRRLLTGGQEHVDHLAEHLGPGVARDALHLAVDEQDLTVVGHDDDTVGHRLHHLEQP